MNTILLFSNKLTAEHFNFKKNFLLSVGLISVYLLSACASQDRTINQPINFCEYVDPSSKLYNPNQLTLEQLSICRSQAEKILSIQTMQLQIHQQRTQSLNNLSVTTPNGKEINTALNQISTQNPDTVSGSNNSNNRKNSNHSRANTTTTNPSSSQPTSHQILVQKTHPNLGETPIQQHYIAQRNSRATQQQLDKEQARRVAGEVTTLLGDPTAQQKLSAPRLLSPGEETRNSASVNNMGANQLVSQNSDQKSLPTENTAPIEPKIVTKKSSMTQEELATKIVESTTNKLPVISTSYTNSPTNIPNADTNSSETTKTNSVAEVVKPQATESVPSTPSTQMQDPSIPVDENKASKPNVDSKSIESYQADPLPSLDGGSSVNKQDPLLLLQQRRAETSPTSTAK